MAQSSKKRLKIAVGAAKTTKMTNGLDALEEYLKPIAAVWHKLTPQQRRAIRQAQPIIDRVIRMTRPIFKKQTDASEE